MCVIYKCTYNVMYKYVYVYVDMCVHKYEYITCACGRMKKFEERAKDLVIF